MSPKSKLSLKNSVFFCFIILLLLLSGCKKNEATLLQLETHKAENTSTSVSWDDIVSSGEFLVGTISGPDTYFDFNGQPAGRQYQLLSNFARKYGLRIRVECAHTQSELEGLLQNGLIDLAMYAISLDSLDYYGLLAAGMTTDTGSWSVNESNTELQQHLNDWYKNLSTEAIADANKAAEEIIRPHVVRKVRSPYLSREKGIISIYDDLFKKAAQTTGWDWRLIASQCYQESGFDPNAVSSAGARGLMQIMPTTASALGLSRVENPEENVAAAARYIVQLTQKFSHIRNKQDQICFVLAAYNGGFGHVSDAQALAKKNGQNHLVWENVRPFVEKLQEPRYYLDPVVQHGYMIGTQTSTYVESIMQRWQQYGGHVSASPTINSYSPSTTTGRKNKYRKETQILKPVED